MRHCVGFVVWLVAITFCSSFAQSFDFKYPTIIDVDDLHMTNLPCLAPESELRFLNIVPDTGPVTLKLCNVQRSTSYEARISYSGAVSATFKLSLAGNPASLEDETAQPLPHHQRQLLDIEKLVFEVHEDGTIGENRMMADSVIIEINVEWFAVTDIPDLRLRPIYFNIALDTLIGGALPVRTVPLLLFLIAAFAVAILLWPYIVRRVEMIRGKELLHVSLGDLLFRNDNTPENNGDDYKRS